MHIPLRMPGQLSAREFDPEVVVALVRRQFRAIVLDFEDVKVPLVIEAPGPDLRFGGVLSPSDFNLGRPAELAASQSPTRQGCPRRLRGRWPVRERARVE